MGTHCFSYFTRLSTGLPLNSNRGYPGFRGIPEEVLFDNRGFPGFTRAEHPPAIHPPPIEKGDVLPIMLKIRTYEENGIRPGEKLLMTFESPDVSLGTKEIKNIIAEYFSPENGR